MTAPRRRHTRSRAATVSVALLVLLLGAGAVVLGVVAPRGIPGRSYYYVNAQFADAANLSPFSEVRIAGRRVGQVLELHHQDGRAVARLQLDGDARPLPADSTARIRLKGLLGQKFVEVTPGESDRPLLDGGTLPTSQTSTTVELDDILQALDPRRRAALRTTLRGLGDGFLGRGEDLNDMFRTAPDVFVELTELADAVLAREGAAQRLFPSAQSASAAYDPVREALAEGFTPQANALRPFIDSRAELQDALEQAPGTLSDLRRGLDASVPLMQETALMARATTRLTRPAPAAMRATAELMRASQEPLRRSEILLERVRAAVPPTLSFLDRFNPVIDPAIRSLRSNVPPFVELGRRRCDLVASLEALGSSLSLGTAEGGGELGPLHVWRAEESSDNSPESDPYPEPCTAIGQKAAGGLPVAVDEP